MKMKKEIFFGLLWGLALGLLTVVLLYSTSKSAEVVGSDGGNLEISISGDSVRVEIDKDGAVRSITVLGDSLQRTSTGMRIEGDLRIEDGKIFIDGIELTEGELEKLSVSEDHDSDEGWSGRKGAHRRVMRNRLATVYNDSSGDMVKFGDIFIDSTVAVNGDVVSISGDITIFGKVTGDVVCVFGNINLKNGADIYGDVAAPMGHVIREPNVTLRGKMSSHKKATKGKVDLGLGARFNRVEGFTLVPTLNFEDKKGQLPKVSIVAAYAFTLKRWEYDFGVSHRFGDGFSPYFDIHLFQAANSSDDWRFTETENTIAGLFFKEDLWDFYWDRGFKGEGGFYLTDNLQAGALYSAERISTLRRTAGKAIFGGKKKFRENWSTILPDSTDILAMPGDLKEGGLTLGYDTISEKDKSATSGVRAQLQWRKTVGSSDFDYQVITGKIQTDIPVASNQFVILNARGGYSDDYLPLFRRFFLGGIGSLRGYDYKEFQGNRYALFSA
ncbi:MAG TPA: hypothetical protein DCZ43_07300, partial [candidate division Zixibacteria bacterium]|nr:hypothetical protein [candidate division Zixibacteria bacterium]